MPIGYLSLVLTAHVPYVRSSTRDFEGEEALHQTIVTSLLPTLRVLDELRTLRLAPRVAVAWSPVLLEQLADPVVQKHFVLWMERWLEQVASEISRWEHQGEEHMAYLGRFYLDWGHGLLDSFTERYRRNLVLGLRELVAAGVIEPLAGAATHAYLPLLSRPESLRAQVDAGSLATTRRLGQRPGGFWLPECGYHPNLEPHMLANEARYLIVDPASVVADVPITHLRPRWLRPPRLMVLIRAEQASEHVWSRTIGYAGDPLYLSMRRDPASGIGWWANATSEAGQAQPYDPYNAFRLAREHAAHFVAAAAAELEAFGRRHDMPGLLVVPLDAEVLGRSWFEGPTWLRAVFDALHEHPAIEPVVPLEYLAAYRPRQHVVLGAGSWGEGGDHRAWSPPDAAGLWRGIHATEQRLAAIVKRRPDAQGMIERALNQATRELLLAQSSDWPLLLGQEWAPREALERPLEHLRRCEQLCDLVERGVPDETGEELLDMLEELDNPFPYLNYRVFTDS